MPRAVVALVLIIAVVIGCTEHTRYRLPYSSPEISTGWPCVQQCENQAAFEKGDKNAAIRACMSKCPGVEVEEGRCRPEDLPPQGYCREHTKIEPTGTQIVQFVGLTVLLVVLLVVYGVAKTGGDD